MKKKLIECGLPLEVINEGSKPETENPFLKGHPRAIHNWWARTPLSVCRAILFGQLVDDPIGDDDVTEEGLAKRRYLTDLVARLATWAGGNDPAVIREAQDVLRNQYQSKLPVVWDMFAGRGSIPIEAMRLGLPVIASDLNPIPFVINTALLKISQRFFGTAPVAGNGRSLPLSSKSVSPFMADIEAYGSRLSEMTSDKIAKLYPKYPVLESEQQENPFWPLMRTGNVDAFAFLQARTIVCPNPACGATVPLISSFLLSKRKSEVIYLRPTILPGKGLKVHVSVGAHGDVPKPPKEGRGAKFRCLCCNHSVPDSWLEAQGNAGQFGSQLLAAVGSVNGETVYLNPSSEYEKLITSIQTNNAPAELLALDPRNLWCASYGLKTVGDLFTSRQIETFSIWLDGLDRLKDEIIKDANLSGQFSEDVRPFRDGGRGSLAYADGLITYLTFAISRLADYHSSLATWNPANENVSHVFQRQAIPMAWDFVEVSPLIGKLTLETGCRWVSESLTRVPTAHQEATVVQADATKLPTNLGREVVISTDPPYFDNISYANLADFFYVWLRRGLRDVFPQEFSTIVTPKEAELVASPYRHEGSTETAAEFVRAGFGSLYRSLWQVAASDIPLTIYYSFRQAEEGSAEDDGIASTGWETMLDGLISAGFMITGTLPIRTSKKARSVARGTNALASTIILVCRKRPSGAGIATRREFVHRLKVELPRAIQLLKENGIAAVDLAQSAIGPGMAIYSQYEGVVEADGRSMGVRTALATINQTLDEISAESEGDFDADSRWAVTWFEAHGFDEGAYGEAETLSKAKNTATSGLVEAGVIAAKGGKVRLIPIESLPEDWNPKTDNRLTIWEVTHHLVRVLETRGEEGAAALIRDLGPHAEVARDLAYRLYSICERKKWAKDALRYNGLIASWSVISRAAVVSEAAKAPIQEILL